MLALSHPVQTGEDRGQAIRPMRAANPPEPKHLRQARIVRGGIMATAVFGPLLAVPYAMSMLWRHEIVGTDVWLFLGLYLATGLGISVGYHRLLAHRSFATSPVLKAVLLILGSMTLQGRCIDWAATHLKHHAHSDRDGDPHSPLEGFFHAHVGWLFKAWPADRTHYCKHLLDDAVIVWIDQTSYLWIALGLLIPYAIDGWRGLLWGGLVRLAFYNQVTYAVNSICHSYGRRPFDTKDRSRNNWFIAILALGEGWHNNHHAFPSMAYHGMTRAQLDLSAMVLRLLGRAHLAWSIKQPSPELIARRRARPVSQDIATVG